MTTDVRFSIPVARWWAESTVLVLGGALLLLGMVPTWGLSLLHPQSFNGVDAYLKPLKFQASLGLYLLCLAWMRGYLTPDGRRGWLAAVWTSVVPTLAAWGEMLYILWRAARGEGSHFNVSSAEAGLAYSLMGVGAVLLVLASGVLAWLLQRQARAGLNAAWLASLRSGLWLTMLLGGLAGAHVSAQTGHLVSAAGGLPATDLGGWPLTGWSRHMGDLRVAHFFGIHAMQMLPLTGWWMVRHWPEAQALRAVRRTAWAYAAWTVATWVQAVAGWPLLFGL